MYIGCVKILAGETWEEALERRLEQHRSDGDFGALWLRICSNLNICRVGRLATSLYEARAFELLTVAAEFLRDGFKVRGGPFSSITLGPAEVAELHALGGLTLIDGKLESEKFSIFRSLFILIPFSFCF